jgi:hypothetical protein
MAGAANVIHLDGVRRFSTRIMKFLRDLYLGQFGAGKGHDSRKILSIKYYIQIQLPRQMEPALEERI